MSGWTPERVAKAKRRWDEGAHASVIGAELGVTRMAVLGLAHRQGWPSRRRVGRKDPRGRDFAGKRGCSPDDRHYRCADPGPAIGRDEIELAMREDIMAGDAKLLRALALHQLRQQAC